MAARPPNFALIPRLGEYLGLESGIIESALAERASGARGVASARLGEVLLHRGDIDRRRLDEAVRAQRVDRLRACALFASLSDGDLAVLAEHFEEVSVPTGEVFITQDSADDYLYVLASGSAQVYRSGPGDEDVELGRVAPGEPVGEMGYFTDGVRSASVRAVDHCQLLRVRYVDLNRCIDRMPGLAKGFWGVVTQRLRQVNVRYQEDHQGRKAAERSLRHLQEFLDLSDAKALGAGIEGLIERMVHTASSLLSADRASLFLLDSATGELWSKVAEGEGVREIRVPAGAGIVGWVAQHQELVNIDDAYRDPRFNQAVDRRTGYRTHTILCAPIWSLSNEVLGVVQVINKKRGRFNVEDERLFKAFAHQAAVAVENFYLYNRMVASHEKMTMLLDIATALGETLDLPSLIHRIVTRMPEMLQCERSSFFVLDRETRELWSMEAHGAGAKEIRFPMSTGLAGHAASTGEIVNIPDAYQDPRFNPAVDRRTGFRTGSVLCVPVCNRDGEIVGVTQVMNHQGGTFDDQDVELLRALSAQIGVAVENATLHASVVEMRDNLKNVQESISNAIVSLSPERKVVTANIAAARLLPGAGGAAPVGRHIAELLGPENPYLLQLVERVYDTGTSVVQLDVAMNGHRDGERVVNANVLPLAARGIVRGHGQGQEQEPGVVLVLEDITRERRVKSTLARYMAKDIVDRVLEDPTLQVLGGISGTATVLFSDIREFTAISETLNASQTMDLLNEYFTVMVDEVFRHQGVLDKFMGDALMAVFGVPFQKDDDAVRAVRTGLGMLKVLEGFNETRVAAGSTPMAIGIGVNSGEVISGNMGSSKRMDYTVIGDGVNLASRLENLTKYYGARLLVSGSTLAAVGDAFLARPIDHVLVRGKSQPIQVFEILAERGGHLTAEQARFCEGLEHYRARKFHEALVRFRDAAHGDGPSRVYAERCRRFLETPPPADWDGVWRGAAS